MLQKHQAAEQNYSSENHRANNTTKQTNKQNQQVTAIHLRTRILLLPISLKLEKGLSLQTPL